MCVIVSNRLPEGSYFDRVFSISKAAILGAAVKRLAIALLAVTGLSVGLSQIASAADLPVKAPIYKAPVVVAPAFSWTGWLCRRQYRLRMGKHCGL